MQAASFPHPPESDSSAWRARRRYGLAGASLRTHRHRGVHDRGHVRIMPARVIVRQPPADAQPSACKHAGTLNMAAAATGHRAGAMPQAEAKVTGLPKYKIESHINSARLQSLRRIVDGG